MPSLFAQYKGRFFAIFFIIFSLLALFLFSPQVIPFKGQTMGTTYNILVFFPGYWQRQQQGLDKVPFADEFKRILADVNSKMSTYDPNSELMQLNKRIAEEHEGQQGQLACHSLSADLMKVLVEAKRIYYLSNGFYDITVGPLVNLWGFGTTGIVNEPPSAAQIQPVLESVGLENLLIDENNQCVQAQKPIQLDLSSIAKGYAIDVLGDFLKSQGLHHFLIEIGGEILVSGHKPALRPWLDDQPWRLGIEQPEPNAPRVEPVSWFKDVDAQVPSLEKNALHQIGIATSGDYRNYFVYKGKTLSHIINPKTGQPISQDIISASVLDPSVMTADALATALIAMPFEQAKQAVEIRGLLAVLYQKTDSSYTVWRSSAFKNREDL